MRKFTSIGVFSGTFYGLMGTFVNAYQEISREFGLSRVGEVIHQISKPAMFPIKMAGEYLSMSSLDDPLVVYATLGLNGLAWGVTGGIAGNLVDRIRGKSDNNLRRLE